MSELHPDKRIPRRFPLLAYVLTAGVMVVVLLGLSFNQAERSLANDLHRAQSLLGLLLSEIEMVAEVTAGEGGNGLPRQALDPRVQAVYLLERTPAGVKVIGAVPSKAVALPLFKSSAFSQSIALGDKTPRLVGNPGNPNAVAYLVSGQRRMHVVVTDTLAYPYPWADFKLDAIRVLARDGQGVEIQFLEFQTVKASARLMAWPREQVAETRRGGTLYRVAVMRSFGLADFPWLFGALGLLLMLPVFWWIGRNNQKVVYLAHHELISREEEAAYAVRNADIQNRNLLEQLNRLKIFPQAIAEVTEAIAIIDRDKRIKFANSAFLNLLIPENQRLRSAENIVVGHLLPAVLNQAMAEGMSFRTQMALHDVSGMELFADIKIVPIGPTDKAAEGERHFVLTIEDITERKRAQDEADLERTRLLVTLRSIGDGVIVVDANNRIRNINLVAEKVLKIENLAALGRSIDDTIRFVHETTQEALINPVVYAVNNKRMTKIQPGTDCITDKGLRFAIDGTVSLIFGADDRLQGAILVFRDVTTDRQERRSVERTAYYDDLTRIANRAHFNKIMQDLFELNAGSGDTHCIAYIDLDHFKEVNDSGGHAVGDAILVGCAQVMSANVRKGDLVSRRGGDEFLILFRHCGLRNAQDCCENIRVEIDALKVEESGKAYSVWASIGVLEFSMAEGVTLPQVIQSADAVMYQAKEAGRNQVIARNYLEMTESTRD